MSRAEWIDLIYKSLAVFFLGVAALCLAVQTLYQRRRYRADQIQVMSDMEQVYASFNQYREDLGNQGGPEQ
jgi:hypothetical protein